MIINIRGTSGSGKSTIVYNLMKKYKTTNVMNKDGKIEATKIFAPYGDIYAIGKYTTPCGGCDGVPTQNGVCRLIGFYSKHGHVIFEGLIVTGCYARYRDLLPTLGMYCMCFLNTPLRTCISRVKKRRLKKGNTKPLNTFNTEQKYHQNKRVIERAEEDGLDYCILDYKRATEEVECLLKSKLGVRSKANMKRFLK